MTKTFVIGDFSFELCSNETIELAMFVVSMNEAKEKIRLYSEMSYEDGREIYHELYKTLESNLDKSCYDKRFESFYDECYRDYFKLASLNDEKYREYAEADFIEYASHKNEPNFDWDFYSDWHKDLYGFRPRF